MKKDRELLRIVKGICSQAAAYLRAHPYCTLLVLWLLTRLTYLAAGLWARARWLENDTPYYTWSYGSPYRALNLWTVWDSGFYYATASHGFEYLPSAERHIELGHHLQHAALPLYPMLSRIGSVLAGDIVFAGVIISNLSLLLGVMLLYKLLTRDADAQLAIGCCILFLLSPFNFMLSAFLAEGLFFGLLIWALYLIRSSTLLASILPFAALLITKTISPMLMLSALPRFFKESISPFRAVARFLIFAAVAAMPLLIHCLFLKRLTGDPFIFLSLQATWGREFSLGAIYAAFVRAADEGPQRILEIAVFFTSVALFIYSLFAWKRRTGVSMPVEYIVVSVVLLIMPIFSGSFESYPRYSAPVFTLFVGLAAIRNPMRLAAAATISFLLSIAAMAVWSLGTRFLI